MEKAYWLGRERTSLKAARSATSSEARLIHYELAGRYNLNAFSAATSAIDLKASLPHGRTIEPHQIHESPGSGPEPRGKQSK